MPRRVESILRAAGVLLALLLLVSLAQGQTYNSAQRAEAKALRFIALSVAQIETAGPGGTPSGLVLVTTPTISSNRQVSKNQDPNQVFRSGASEVTIAATDDGDRLVAGWNDGEGFAFAPFGPPPTLGLSGYGYSTDGGQTWVDAGAPPAGTVVALGPGTAGRSKTGRYVTRGDPWLDSTGPGRSTFYYANIAVWEDDAALPPAGLSIHRGGFSNSSFAWRDAVLLQSPNYPRDFLDKEALAASGSAIYMTTTNFIEVCDIDFFGFGQIELYRSLDGGTIWSRRIIQPDESVITDPNNPLCGQDGIVNQGSAPAVGPSGELYVAWERGWFAPILGGTAGQARASIAVRRSFDQGNTFGSLVTVASICSIVINPFRTDPSPGLLPAGGPNGYNRTTINDFPRVAVAHRGNFTGRVYVAFQDCTAAHGPVPFGQDSDVFLSFSDDQGRTWSPPIPLHLVADGKIQFWPVVAVDNLGRVNVAYYESNEVNVTPDPTDFECSVRTGGPLTNPTRKNSRKSSLVDVMLVRSRDGGTTWSAPVRINTVTTNWCRATPLNSIIPNFGDYNDLRSTGRPVLAIWGDGRNGGRTDHVPTVWFATGR